MRRELLTGLELEAARAGLAEWIVDGQTLKKRWEFTDFAGSLAFINKVAELAEAADHHPDITFGWDYAEISLTTHDRGGITDVDIELASKIDRLQGRR
jgi:4a-hydroxytetrahydrobiopterin dehydratase